MENELNLRVGKYWLLYYQPLPEAGERIAIALVFENGRRGATLEYDPSFAKAAKVFPDLDQSSLKFFLDSLKNELLSPSSVEAILGMYGPQVAASTARKIEIPVTTSAIDLLMAKYVYPAKKTRSRERVDQVAVEISLCSRATRARHGSADECRSEGYRRSRHRRRKKNRPRHPWKSRLDFGRWCRSQPINPKRRSPSSRRHF